MSGCPTAFWEDVLGFDLVPSIAGSAKPAAQPAVDAIATPRFLHKKDGI